MRIAFFVQYSHPVGTYFRWHNLAIGLKQLGHEVDVYAGDHNWKTSIRHEVRDCVNYYIVPSLESVRFFYNPNDPFTAIRKLFHLPKKEYDIYHLFQPFLHAFLPWNMLRKKKKKAAFLYDWDDLWTDGLIVNPKGIRNNISARITAYMEKKLPHLSNGITTCSTFLSNRLPKGLNSAMFANGFWPMSILSKVNMRKKWGFDDNIFYIAYIGKTAGELDWIAEAMAKLLIPSVQLVIVGPPKAQVDNLDMAKDKFIYMGEVSPLEAKEIATAVDLGLIPLENNLFNQSRFPIKFFDFLIVGTPIYMSDVGEIASIGKHNSNVFISANNKATWINQLNDAIVYFKRHQKEDNEDIAASVQEYAWPTIALKLASYYQHQLNSITGN